MQNKLVSIVLPTYNRAQHIGKSIESVLRQTYENFELIIVDDCSIDNTADVVRAFDDKRIRYIKHEENKRLPSALNTGFFHSKGDYLTWTSDDNEYLESAIEKMVVYLKHTDKEFVCADYYIVNSKLDASAANHERPKRLVRCSPIDNIKRGNNIGACFLYTKNVYKNIGEYDVNAELAEDYDYWLRVYAKFEIGHIGEPLYIYGQHSESLSSTRYCEVKIVDCLVKLKNRIIESYEINEQIFELFIRNQRRPLRLICKIICKLRYGQRINRILSEFSVGSLDFRSAKQELMLFFKNN